MLSFELSHTGLRNHCILKGPMGDIVSAEFTSPHAAALFAQQQARGMKAVLWIINESGSSEGYHFIPALHPERQGVLASA